MWTDYTTVEEETEAVEWALEKCYLAMLRAWLPAVTPMVTSDVPDGPQTPDALVGESAMAMWEQLEYDYVLPAVAMIWCNAYLRTCWEMKVWPFPDAPLTAAAPVDPSSPWDPDWPRRTPEGHARWLEQVAERSAGPGGSWGASENWTHDYPTWLQHLQQNRAEWDRQKIPAPGYGPGERIENVIEGEWPKFDWEDDTKRFAPPIGKYNPGQRNDVVADLVALAWDTNPEQMKLAVQLVWNDASSKRKVQRFLGDFRKAKNRVGNSIPGRVRDMLVGSTSRRARQAIPMEKFNEVMGPWLGMGVGTHGGKPSRTSRHEVPGWRTKKRKDWELETNVEKTSAGTTMPDWDIPKPQPAMSFFQPFRDVAKESGFQAAGIINQAVIIAASQSDISFDIIWIARMDGRTRPTHFAADGQRCSPEGTFLVGGFVLAYPGDPAGPPQEVRNCRCRVGMVEEGQPMPPEMKRTPRQKQEIARRTAAGIVRAREDPNGIGYITVMSDDSKPERPRTASAGQETDMTTTSVIGVDQEQEPVTYRVFSDAVVAFLGVPTSDNRLLQADMDLRFRAFPLPLMWCKQSKEGHADSYTVGVIESGRVEDGKVYASGYMLNSPEADEAVELLSHGVTRPGVDLASAEWAMTDEAGVVITEEQAYALPADAKVFTAFSAAELIGTTLVSTPAFGDTSLALGDTREPRDSTLVASAAAHVAPRTYPAEFFTDPHLTEPTMPTMDPGGRIYGHVACWGQCHRSVQASCVTAPASPTNYSHFHTSSVRTDDGLRLPVGRLTIGTGHASDKLAGVPAQAHYDDTGSCWALVKVGEDAHGIWFSGVAAPWATPEQVEAGLCAPLSGDWRDFGQGLELVAALSVNTPGFVARGREDDLGRPVTLVASLGPHADREPRSIRDDVKAAVREALAEQQLTARRDAALARAEKLGPPPSPRERIEKLLTRAGL